jgi:hypothetical protein
MVEARALIVLQVVAEPVILVAVRHTVHVAGAMALWFRDLERGLSLLVGGSGWRPWLARRGFRPPLRTSLRENRECYELYQSNRRNQLSLHPLPLEQVENKSVYDLCER